MVQLLNEYMALPYTVYTEVVTEEAGNPYWFAQIVEIDGCVATGKTEVEASNRVMKALRACLAVMLERGESPPTPKVLPKVDPESLVVPVLETEFSVLPKTTSNSTLEKRRRSPIRSSEKAQEVEAELQIAGAG